MQELAKQLKDYRTTLQSWLPRPNSGGQGTTGAVGAEINSLRPPVSSNTNRPQLALEFVRSDYFDAVFRSYAAAKG